MKLARSRSNSIEMSRQADYNAFREMYPEFIYESYDYDVQPDGLHIAFSFRMNGTPTSSSAKLVFEPTAFIPARTFLHPESVSRETLDTLVFNIGMIELVSYWKCYCPPTVIVKPFHLDEQQIAFWKKLYYNGLGEFFYINGIEATQDDFMQIRPQSTQAFKHLSTQALNHSIIHIVPIGGGKDSVVTLELLHGSPLRLAKGNGNLRPLIMNPRGAPVSCIERAGYTLDDVIVIKRSIHPLLLEENKRGALNGHTPFSAMLAFYTLLASALTGCRTRIALSNENSANESTVIERRTEWRAVGSADNGERKTGMNVNHQYSKSIEFEDDFRSYVKNYITNDFDYYSFLRPLSELQIAMFFARFEKYHDIFRSCNVGSKEDIWCGHCAKCLFAYIILSPFIEPERLNAIFGKNMLDDSSLQHEFDQLRGAAETKPFECVGTVDEVNSALAMTLARWYPAERPALLKNWSARVPAGITSLDELNPRNNLPEGELEVIEKEVRHSCRTAIPFRYRELFNLLAFKRVLIAGYGREGQSSERLLKMLFPRGNSYDIAHNEDEIRNLLANNNYDIVLKSPGIPTFFFDGLCDPQIISSQADIFLRVYGDLTIGITGTKGKSTTTTLIHHILIRANTCDTRRLLLAGNIGIPLFDIIPQIDSNTTVVAELSCHQLENIRRAPHISLLLNLYQEHLDHYRSYEGYKMAKMQIALRQSPNDYFVYCTDSDDLREMVEAHRSELHQTVTPYSLAEWYAWYAGVLACDNAKHSNNYTIPLPGDHNLSNIYAAHLVTNLLDVSVTQFLEAIQSFKGLEHRLEKVATKGGITYYNDSISTIPQTTIAAIEALKEVHALILGGFDRGIDYAPLVEYLEHSEKGKNINCIVLVGSAGKKISELWSALRSAHVPVGIPSSCNTRNLMSHFDTDYSMEEAVAFVAKHARPDGICLLSPAASSYDHYKNFEERGTHFKTCVNKLIS